jgi:predicted nucleic acid-binding protein
MARRTVRLFLDSNVILSGLLSDRGAPRIILDLLSHGLPFLTGLTGRYNLLEIERNLKKRMPGIWSVYKRYLPRLNLTVISMPQPEELREVWGKIADKDVPVLVSAIRGKADFLIPEDKRHFEKIKELGTYQLKIVTPSEFIDSILPEILGELESA